MQNQIKICKPKIILFSSVEKKNLWREAFKWKIHQFSKNLVKEDQQGRHKNLQNKIIFFTDFSN